MKNYLKVLTLLLSVVTLASCMSPSIDDYAGTSPNLDLKTFFNGELVAYGMVLDRTGQLTRRFNVKLQASWDGDNGVIDEQFVFDDGEKTTRVWRLIKTDNNSYQGRADDVLGIAYGKTSGSVLHWKYDMVINFDGSDYEVSLDDWMYLVDDNRLFNKTDIIKFGFKVGEIVLYIEKVS
jgi:hypothetical protein